MPKRSNEYKDRMTVLNDCSEDKKKRTRAFFDSPIRKVKDSYDAYIDENKMRMKYDLILQR
jgi:hypothetical protein